MRANFRPTYDPHGHNPFRPRPATPFLKHSGLPGPLHMDENIHPLPPAARPERERIGKDE